MADGEIDPILELEDAVYSCWSFQINVPRAVYESKGAHLHEIDVTAEDIRASGELPKNHRLSPLAFWTPSTMRQFGSGKLVPAQSGHGEAAIRYTLDWTRRGEAYSILVGDITETVARWRLNSMELEYNEQTRTVPDDRSWQLFHAIGRWQNQYRSLVPQGMRLHPREAIEYLRHLPVFTDALNALLAFDRHTPTAVLPDDARATRLPINEQDDGPTARVADLSILESILEEIKPTPTPTPTPAQQKTDAESENDADPGRSAVPETARLISKERVSLDTLLKETADEEQTDDAPAIS